jgi:hypothetical protein
MRRLSEGIGLLGDTIQDLREAEFAGRALRIGMRTGRKGQQQCGGYCPANPHDTIHFTVTVLKLTIRLK